MPVHGSYAIDVLPGMLIASLGMGAIFMPLTLIATTGLKDEDQGLASGLFNTSQQIGGALGLAILSTIAASQEHGNPFASAQLVHGCHYAFVGAACLVARRPRCHPRPAPQAPRRTIDPRRRAAGARRGRLMVELRADAQRNRERVLDAAMRGLRRVGSRRERRRDREAGRRRARRPCSAASRRRTT